MLIFSHSLTVNHRISKLPNEFTNKDFFSRLTSGVIRINVTVYRRDQHSDNDRGMLKAPVLLTYNTLIHSELYFLTEKPGSVRYQKFKIQDHPKIYSNISRILETIFRLVKTSILGYYFKDARTCHLATAVKVESFLSFSGNV